MILRAIDENIPGAGNDAAKDAAGISVKASASFSPSDTKDNTKNRTWMMLIALPPVLMIDPLWTRMKRMICRIRKKKKCGRG